MRRASDGTPLLPTEVLGAVADALGDRAPERVVFAPGGEVAWDGECEGQLWARIVSVEANYQSGRCPSTYLLTLAVGIIRCVAVLDDQGRAPEPHELITDADAAARDMADIARALQCHVPDEALSAAVTTWTPLGPQGGRAGGEWQYAVRLTAPL